MACTVYSLNGLAASAGAKVLVLGAGASGLLFDQILKVTGASKVVLATNKGKKTQIAREIGAVDEYVKSERDRAQADVQWEKLKEDYPFGFDTVIKATGSTVRCK
ncbi:hypothetical protein DFS33DRAFT_1384360 [Desarmillaria ectypa]|nr:hypothetical protein DFS33DRAFT_1384360 [Desarmillaria ectypa]